MLSQRLHALLALPSDANRAYGSMGFQRMVSWPTCSSCLPARLPPSSQVGNLLAQLVCAAYVMCSRPPQLEKQLPLLEQSICNYCGDDQLLATSSTVTHAGVASVPVVEREESDDDDL